MVLPADEREAVAELEEEVLQSGHQRGFEFSFGGSVGEVEEVEHVGVTDELVGEVGVAGGELVGEIGGRRSDPLV